MSRRKTPVNARCNKLYSSLIRLQPQYKDLIDYYGPVDTHTLRFHTYYRESYIFEYVSDVQWFVQTERDYFNSQSKQALR